METVDNRSFKEKVRDFCIKAKEKVSEGVETVVETVKNHPMETFTLVCLAVPGILKCTNSAIRAHQQNQLTRYNECDVYDPRTGTHWYIKKPLTSRQKLNLEEQYKTGRNKGDILREMGML